MLIRTLALALPVVLPNVIVPVEAPKAFGATEPPTKVPAKTVVPPL